jgi:preprotein translocase subunit YajC
MFALLAVPYLPVVLTRRFLERPGLIPMLGSLAPFFFFFAQAPAGPAKGEPSPYLQFAPFVAAPFIFYFLMIRPQQLQEKKRKEMIGKLKKNDKVLTASGMYGTVVSVDDQNDRIQLRLDDDGKVKITFTRASIVRVFNEAGEKPAEAK